MPRFVAFDTAAAEIVNLHPMQLAVRKILEPADLFHAADLRMYQIDAAEGIALELRAFVYGSQNIAEPRVLRFPLTWIDAVLLRFAPAWLLRRRPVQYETITLTVDEVFRGVPPAHRYGNGVSAVRVLKMNDRAV